MDHCEMEFMQSYMWHR